MLENIFGSSRFSMPTAEKLESALLHNAYVMFSGYHPLRRYISTVCVLRYLSARPSESIYNNYDPFIKQITQAVSTFTAMELASVRVYKPFSKSSLGTLISAGWWFSQAAQKKKDIAKHTLLSTSKQGVFFDTRMFSETNSPAANELIECRDDNSVWLFHRTESRSSIEDVAMAVTEYLIEHGFREKRPPLHDTLNPFVKQWLQEKKRSQQSRSKKTLLHIEEKMVPTRLLKRLQMDLPLSQDNAKTIDQKALQSLSALPDMLYDTMLDKLSPLLEMHSVLQAPARLRSRLMCVMLKNVMSTKGQFVLSDTATVVMHKCNFRLLFSSEDIAGALDSGVRRLCDQAAESIVWLTDSQLRHIDKLSFLSKQDKVRMKKWSTNYRLAQCNLEHNFTPDSLYSANTALSIYLSGKDKGVTAARLRKLFESMLGEEPGHDIFHQHIVQLSDLFGLWPDNHASTLNKIIDLLQSQIGGANELHLRFNYWSNFRQLAKAAPFLSRSTFHNLKDAVELASMDPQSVVKFEKQLKQDRFVYQDPEINLLKTACVMGLVDAIPGYIKSVQKSPFAYEIPAIDHRTSTRLGDIHVEIRPHHDLVGIMGVASHGVCIGFGGHAHMSHWNNAVAHLIVRDDEKIWLWGLLLREQRHTSTPQYFLNNLQGALPSRYAKQKEQVANTIRAVLSSIGHVFFKDLSFNAISLKTDELAKSIGHHRLSLPSLRLDISNYRKGVDGIDSTLCVINEPTMVLCKSDSPPPEFDNDLYDGHDYDDVT